MPNVGVRGERWQRILKPGRVQEDDDAAKKAVAHEKCEERLADSFPAQPWVGKQYIHGHTAKLEGQLPPVIGAASNTESQGKLLPDLAAQHENTAQKEQSVRCFWEIFFSP